MVSSLQKGCLEILRIFFFYIRKSCIQEKIKQYSLKHDKASVASVPKLDVPCSSIMEILFREEGNSLSFGWGWWLFLMLHKAQQILNNA